MIRINFNRTALDRKLNQLRRGQLEQHINQSIADAYFDHLQAVTLNAPDANPFDNRLQRVSGALSRSARREDSRNASFIHFEAEHAQYHEDVFERDLADQTDALTRLANQVLTDFLKD